MTIRDSRYYRERALTERERATAISDPDLATVHHELARAYEAMASTGEARPKLTISSTARRR
jgi:hypothetical protein